MIYFSNPHCDAERQNRSLQFCTRSYFHFVLMCTQGFWGVKNNRFYALFSLKRKNGFGFHGTFFPLWSIAVKVLQQIENAAFRCPPVC